MEAGVGNETQCEIGIGLASALGTPAAAVFMTTTGSTEDDRTETPGNAPTEEEGMLVWTGGQLKGWKDGYLPRLMEPKFGGGC